MQAEMLKQSRTRFSKAIVGWFSGHLRASQAHNEVDGALFLDIFFGKGAEIMEFAASKDVSLLGRRNAFEVLDLLLDPLYRVAWLDIESDLLASQRLNKYLHSRSFLSVGQSLGSRRRVEINRNRRR